MRRRPPRRARPARLSRPPPPLWRPGGRPPPPGRAPWRRSGGSRLRSPPARPAGGGRPPPALAAEPPPALAAEPPPALAAEPPPALAAEPAPAGAAPPQRSAGGAPRRRLGRSCEGPLGAAAAGAGVRGAGVAERPGQRFEARLEGVMRKVALLEHDVQGAARAGDHALQEVPSLAGIEVAELAGARLDRDPPDQIGAAGQVDGDARPGLVQRDGRVAEAAHLGLVPERLPKRLAERDAGVLDSVVRVD